MTGRLRALASGEEASEHGVELAAAPAIGGDAASARSQERGIVGISHENDDEGAGPALERVEQSAVGRVEAGVVQEQDRRVRLGGARSISSATTVTSGVIPYDAIAPPTKRASSRITGSTVMRAARADSRGKTTTTCPFKLRRAHPRIQWVILGLAEERRLPAVPAASTGGRGCRPAGAA